MRRISRTVRRIDSSFRGRCYEMDPCTAARSERARRTRNERTGVRERERERSRHRERSWASPSHPPPLLPPRDKPTSSCAHTATVSPPPPPTFHPYTHLSVPFCSRYYFCKYYKLSRTVIELLRPRPHGKFDGISRLMPLQRSAPCRLSPFTVAPAFFSFGCVTRSSHPTSRFSLFDLRVSSRK